MLLLAGVAYWMELTDWMMSENIAQNM